MSKVARAKILVTIEYDVEQTFEDDVSIHDMRDGWSKFININDLAEDGVFTFDSVIPQEWSVIEEDINHIECKGEEWSR